MAINHTFRQTYRTFLSPSISRQRLHSSLPKFIQFPKSQLSYHNCSPNPFAFHKCQLRCSCSQTFPLWIHRIRAQFWPQFFSQTPFETSITSQRWVIFKKFFEQHRWETTLSKSSIVHSFLYLSHDKVSTLRSSLFTPQIHSIPQIPI